MGFPQCLHALDEVCFRNVTIVEVFKEYSKNKVQTVQTDRVKLSGISLILCRVQAHLCISG